MDTNNTNEHYDPDIERRGEWTYPAMERRPVAPPKSN